jgi:hypothetical protein
MKTLNLSVGTTFYIIELSRYTHHRFIIYFRQNELQLYIALPINTSSELEAQSEILLTLDRFHEERNLLDIIP